jgi:hypothetical protein
LDVEKADPTTPPSSIIFLDVDGVLIDEENPNRHAAIAEKAKELFERNKQPKDKFTQLEMAIAASHFFSCTSVANLEDLIERRQKTMRVFIVIISEWRIGLTIEELRKQVFARCSFSKLIIDKTPDNHFIRSSANPDEKDPAVISKEKYNFDLSSRARQADFWLRENRQLYNIYSHVILDNYNDEFSERFPKNFIQVLFPLSKSNVDEADQIMSKVLVKL